jgi:glucosamine kinase
LAGGLIAGVDGGGSSTKVLIADESGRELSSFEGAPSVLRPGGAVESARVIAESVLAARAVSEQPDGPLLVICAGVAGAGRMAAREALAAELERAAIAEDVVVDSDAAVAMEDALGPHSGILLLAGTGSVAFGRGPTGAFARCGGWGAACGDEGGGYWLGRRALSVVTAASDGREPETSLLGAVLTAAEVNSVEELASWAATADVRQIARLAGAVLREAEQGDVRANSLVSLAAEELVAHVRTLAKQLFGDERSGHAVALSGGLMAPGSLMRKRVEDRLVSAVPGGVVRPEPVVPARGALRIAQRTLAAVTSTRE